MNVSGQRMTRRLPTFRGGRRLHQSLNVSVANGGILPVRRDAADHLEQLAETGALAEEVDDARASSEAIRAHQ